MSGAKGESIPGQRVSPDSPGEAAPKGAGESARDRREARQAEALRRNLMKRKQQARGRKGAAGGED